MTLRCGSSVLYLIRTLSAKMHSLHECQYSTILPLWSLNLIFTEGPLTHKRHCPGSRSTIFATVSLPNRFSSYIMRKSIIAKAVIIYAATKTNNPIDNLTTSPRHPTEKMDKSTTPKIPIIQPNAAIQNNISLLKANTTITIKPKSANIIAPMMPLLLTNSVFIYL